MFFCYKLTESILFLSYSKILKGIIMQLSPTEYVQQYANLELEYYVKSGGG